MIEPIINFIGKDTIFLRIFNSRPKKMVSFFLLFLACLSILIPFSVFFITNLTIGFGFIITLIIFFGSGLYLFRLYLWNRYGSEVYQIKKNQLIFFYDYRLFKDHLSKKTFKKIELGFRLQIDESETFDLEHLNYEGNRFYYLSLEVDDEIFNSRIEITGSDLRKIYTMLDKLV